MLEADRPECWDVLSQGGQGNREILKVFSELLPLGLLCCGVHVIFTYRIGCASVTNSPSISGMTILTTAGNCSPCSGSMEPLRLLQYRGFVISTQASMSVITKGFASAHKPLTPVLLTTLPNYKACVCVCVCVCGRG